MRTERAVSGRCDPSAPNASECEPAPLTCCHHLRCSVQGTAELNRSHAARLAAGGRLPLAAGKLSLPKGLGSVVHQLGCTGMWIWSRRGRQVAGREALRAMCAGSEGDGARVRDAATHVESGLEEVDRRDPRRGVEPRCLAEAGGK